MKKRGYILLFLLLAIVESYAEVVVGVYLDSSRILVGQQTTLTISVEYGLEDQVENIAWPDLKKILDPTFEVVKENEADTSDHSPGPVQKSFIITSFTEGEHIISPLTIKVNDADQYESMSPLRLIVDVPLIDTTKSIKDIKPPLEEPFTFNEALPYIGWSLAAIGTIVLMAYLISLLIKKAKHKPAKEPEIVLPEHIIALTALKELASKKLWQNDKLKKYYSEISDILRAYIEKRYKVQTQEVTTEEILSQFKTVVIDTENKERMSKILKLSDLVKFAKETPLPNENEMAITEAETFIEGTKREEEANKSDLSNNSTVETNTQEKDA